MDDTIAGRSGVCGAADGVVGDKTESTGMSAGQREDSPTIKAREK